MDLISYSNKDDKCLLLIMKFNYLNMKIYLKKKIRKNKKKNKQYIIEMFRKG